MQKEYKTIQEIFNQYKIINVPYYQREYVWGNKNQGSNLYKFIDDIISQYNNNSLNDYFIGTLAFCSTSSHDVIDGQQRITSLILILWVLANNFCSEKIKNENDNLIFPKKNNFILQEESYLTEELKFNFNLTNNYKTQGFSADISTTIDRIKNQLKEINNTTEWFDNLYKYIIERISFIWIEFNNINESLKYFLNINSLSILLTQSDIFFSILSQSLRISKFDNKYKIYDLKQKIKELSNFKGINNDLEEYKNNYESKDLKGIDNIIYIFLSSYFQNDKNINLLNINGIGKWLSFYKNDIFNDQLISKDFVENFIKYLNDFETLYKYFLNLNNKIEKENSNLYLSSILLNNESQKDILEYLYIIFKKRHNYNSMNLYKDNSNEIDVNKINEISKRLNLTLISNYITNSNKRLEKLISNISLVENEYEKSIEDILKDINYDNIFNLQFNDKKSVSDIKVNDQSKNIKIIMSLQEAFLNSKANLNKKFNFYVKDLLSVKFSIEHFYSITEYTDLNRRTKWIEKNKFNDEYSFDLIRFKFENLSLLNQKDNASANNNTMIAKINTYRQANSINNGEPEYLIQSLVEDSIYYKSVNLQNLDLPPRFIQNIKQNTWELSENNREFNIKLLKLAIQYIANEFDDKNEQ